MRNCQLHLANRTKRVSESLIYAKKCWKKALKKYKTLVFQKLKY